MTTTKRMATETAWRCKRQRQAEASWWDRLVSVRKCDVGWKIAAEKPTRRAIALSRWLSAYTLVMKAGANRDSLV